MVDTKLFNWWVGVVEDRKDPEKLGRVRVRIAGVHSDNRTLVPTSDLPWAVIMQPTTSAAVSGIGTAPVGLVTGTWCVGFFMDGDDMQQPIVMGTIGGKPKPLASTDNKLKGDATNPPNVVRSSDGSPVVDSSGNPILSEENPTGDATIASELPPLSQDQLQKLMDAIGEKESSSSGSTQNYSTVNTYGYVGKYQFGAAALATLGYVKTPVNAKLTNDILDTDSNWTGKSGISSKDKFLRNGQVQETVMFENLKFNYGVLKRKGTITSNDKAGRVAGLLSVSHLLGAGGATNFAIGNDSKDAFGTSGRTYYDLGAAAVGEDIPLESEAESQIDENTDPAGALNDMATLRPVPFSDPNKQYPKKDYANLPDTNKLALGNISKTAIEKRRNSVRHDVDVVKGDPWDEPKPAYGAKYPYNQTFETEAGHLVEFDNTPGFERIHIYHKKGSFIEIDVNGSSIRKVVGDNYEIIERNNYLFTRGAYKMTIEGATQILVKNDADIQVMGGLNATVNGNMTTKVAGDFNVNAGGAFNVKAKDFNLMAMGSFNAQMATGFSLNSGGAFNVVGATGVNIDSLTTTFINSGMAIPSVAASMAQSALALAKLGLAPDSVLLDRTDTTPLQTPEYTPEAFALDAGEPGADELHQKQVESGDVVETEPIEGESAEPEDNNIEPIECDCNEFANETDFPDSLILSKYFTLGSLSSQATVVSDSVEAQRGLSKGQIVCNLKNLAVNCLDKIKQKYPDMRVTNAFRLDGGSGKNVSDHGAGRAADIQIPSAKATDYFAIVNWISANVPYKQLLLEYGGGSKNPWIHIAFDKSGQKHSLSTATFKDHKVYARNKFVNLA